MINKLTHFIFLLCSILSFSQEFSLSGVLNDINNVVIPYANVVLLTKDSKTPLTGSTTNEEGQFLITQIKNGDYFLKISYLGFETFEKKFSISNDINLGVIILKENVENLDGVTVVSKRPTVKRTVDRLIFNVENSTLSNQNVFDVLKHTPGVIVQDEKITVKNSPPVIYINDRRVHLSETEVVQLLEGTPASNIKSVEVITNPPAKYDAEGGAVLNIVTSKNIIAGYHGSIFGNFKQGFQFPKYSAGTSHFYKAKKLGAYLSYNVSPRKDYRYQYQTVNFIENNQTETSWETDYERVRESANRNISANIDYEINDKNSIGFTSNVMLQPRRGTQTDIFSSTQVFDANKNLDSIFDTSNEAVSEKFNLAFTLDYVKKFKKEGEKLSVSLHHTYFDDSNFQDVNTDYFYPNTVNAFRENKFQTYNSQVIRLSTGQIDYELPLNESKIETGIKLSHINSDSEIDQFIFVDGEKEEDFNNSNVFLYDEFNYAAYFSYAKEWAKWSLKLGLRSEFTQLEGISVFDTNTNNKDYFKLFPTFHLLHAFNDNNQVYLQYNRRIYRPRFEELNPFKFYLNDNTYIVGDPNLLPQIDDSFILGYTLKSNYTFELYYRNENNPFYEIKFQDNQNNQMQYVYANVNDAVSYGLDFMTYTPIVNRWNLYVLSSLFYYESTFKTFDTNTPYLNKKWSFYLLMYHYFSLLKDHSLSLDVSCTYLSANVDGPSNVSGRGNLDINLRKTFWNNKASLGIGVTDVFNTQNFNESTQFLNQSSYYDSKMENRMFVASFNYKFGNYRLSTNKRNIEVEERERLD
ncbi:hypothetical protein PK35_07965 [Tamlana nanhaiensis]|uniref:Outer membrane protein beta-barrel domain-containing protein n=1 Tax=Neotamlana nanhaiensis TaxID=1382798 RepID=A0A0D7W1A0_9FLAO|nr:outer membrane beta-barrel family protein [Tamlana nanhaiensis]KJD32905.1 hypothetical protein PK35_07965 [Tamlana nanhaiensis]